ncbi:MAG: PorT family protein [Flavobacteriales bacterium]|nr:PorT family protein [Flavobacteriales bacterium]PIE86967.1 MAG: hypothetical protein CSA03_02875 [Bacteroidota bacterium]
MVVVSASVVAQTEVEDRREDVNFGLKAGANISNVWDENQGDFEANSKAGFVGGAFISIPLGEYVGVQPSVIYSQKGFQEQGQVLGNSYTFTRTTNYLDIPVLFEFKPTKMLTIVAGPQYSFLMSKEDQFTSGTLSATDFERYENENIRKNTLGAVVGFDVNVNDWVISPRAGWDLQSNDGDGTSSDIRYKNQWLQLAVGYRF